MSTSLPALGIWMAASLAALLVVQRWLSAHLQRLLFYLTRQLHLALAAYAFLFLPGVVLHEASHWLAARLLGVRTQGVSILPKLNRDGTLRLGYVATESADPLRNSLIGAAPLVSGTLVLGLLGFGVLRLDQLGWALAGVGGHSLRSALAGVMSVRLWPLWLYLIFAISNTMIPSRSDRASWWWLVVGGGLIAVALYALGAAQTIAGLARAPLANVLGYLGAVFSLTVLVDLAAGIPIWLVESLLARR